MVSCSIRWICFRNGDKVAEKVAEHTDEPRTNRSRTVDRAFRIRTDTLHEQAVRVVIQIVLLQLLCEPIGLLTIVERLDVLHLIPRP